MTDPAAAQDAGPTWDPIVRITYWGIADAVLLNGIATEEGSRIHVWVGYAALALLALRLLWGFIGAPEARFSAFPPSLSAARAQIADMLAGGHHAHRSHNPLGALMVYALWSMLAVVAPTGIGMAGLPLASRPCDGGEAAYATYEEHEEDGEEQALPEAFEEVHEAAANVLFGLAALHVAGVIFESRRSSLNLVRGMITGRRRRNRTA